MKMVQSLPDGYRMVFNLYAIEGYSHEEIAEQSWHFHRNIKITACKGPQIASVMLEPDKYSSEGRLAMRKLGQHIVDRAFEEGLQGAEMPVLAKVWAGINSELEKDQNSRRKVFFYRSIAAASILLLFGLSTWMFVFQGTQDRV